MKLPYTSKDKADQRKADSALIEALSEMKTRDGRHVLTELHDAYNKMVEALKKFEAFKGRRRSKRPLKPVFTLPERNDRGNRKSYVKDKPEDIKKDVLVIQTYGKDADYVGKVYHMENEAFNLFEL